jgi:3-methyl-2-oxobutanoate hydroxymethyltransferase
MLGLSIDFSPRFLRRYNNLAEQVQDSVNAYINDVKTIDFPNDREQY